MLVSFFRAIILYVGVIICVRVMGKRQIGELQPSELVITLLISEVAAIPMQNNDIPLINAFVPLLVLVSLEIIVSVISLKSNTFRRIMQGNPIIIINNGVINQKEIKRLRFTVEDITEELHKKDIFNIDEVLYAIAETDGSISIMLKAENQPLTAKALQIKIPEDELYITIIDDGEILSKNFIDCNITDEKLNNILTTNNITEDDVLILSVSKSGKYNLIKKDI